MAEVRLRARVAGWLRPRSASDVLNGWLTLALVGVIGIPPRGPWDAVIRCLVVVLAVSAVLRSAQWAWYRWRRSGP